MPLPEPITRHLNRALPRAGRSGETNSQATITGDLDNAELLELIRTAQLHHARVVLVGGALQIRTGQ